MKITGTVVYEDIEGGFWGIAGDDGGKYRPVNDLPGAVRQPGTRIEADVEPVDVVSIYMWGKNVTVRNARRL